MTESTLSSVIPPGRPHPGGITFPAGTWARKGGVRRVSGGLCRPVPRAGAGPSVRSVMKVGVRGIGRGADAHAARSADPEAANPGSKGSPQRKQAQTGPISFRADAARAFDDRCARTDARTVSVWTVRRRSRSATPPADATAPNGPGSCAGVWCRLTRRCRCFTQHRPPGRGRVDRGSPVNRLRALWMEGAAPGRPDPPAGCAPTRGPVAFSLGQSTEITGGSFSPTVQSRRQGVSLSTEALGRVWPGATCATRDHPG